MTVQPRRVPTSARRQPESARSARIAKELRHYDAETHRGMFALPKYLRQGLAAETRTNRDAAPVFMA